MTRDLLGALRFLIRNPLFTLAVTVILGLGIGANTAAFSIVDAVLLRPLPYKSFERLVRIEEVNPSWSSKPLRRRTTGSGEAAMTFSIRRRRTARMLSH